MRFSRTLGMAAMLTAVVACHDVAAPPPQQAPVPKDPAAQQLADVSRALAIALDDSAARAQTVAALRASPWVQHSLHLDELVAASPAVAARLERQLGSAIGERPDFATIDVVLPLRAHRRGWTGEALYVVAPTNHTARAEIGYDRRGVVRRLAGSADLKAGEVAIVVMPADERFRRMLPDEALAVTDAVEAENDVHGAMSYVRYEPNGDSVRVEYLTPTRTVEHRYASSLAYLTNPYSPPAPPPPDTLLLSYLMKNNYDEDCDGPILGFCESTSEVEVILTVDGVRTGRIYLQDVQRYEQQIGNRPAMAFTVPRPAGSTFRVYVAETDAGSNNDDLYCNYKAFPSVYYGDPTGMRIVCDESQINGEHGATDDGAITTDWVWTPDHQKNPPRVGSVTVAPATKSLNVNGVVAITADAYNTQGSYMNFVGFDFASSDEVVATPYPQAYNRATVVARNYGTATVTATATSFGGGSNTMKVAVCPETSCVPLTGKYFSHFSGANCTGTEYYYTAYYSNGTRYSWDGRGAAGGTVRSNTLVRSYKDTDGNCTNPSTWGSAGYSFNGMVNIYKSPVCGEASCVPVTEPFISHFTGANCTGTEYYYTQYNEADGIRRSYNGTGIAGTTESTQWVRSYWRNDSQGCRGSAWPDGNELQHLVRIYR